MPAVFRNLPVLLTFFAACALYAEEPSTPARVPPRNPVPYADVQWDSVRRVASTSHAHIGTQATLDRAYEDGLRFFTISNYYPSAPWWPLADIRTNQFRAGQEHGVMVRGEFKNGPFDWNAVLQDPETGWAGGLPDDLRSQIPFVVGGQVFTNIPGDILEAPNAEHHSFTDTQLHLCAPGSAFRSGNFDARNRFKLVDHGYAMGVARPWKEAFALILGGLIVPDGGGVTINHPVWSKLSREDVIEMLDFDPRVLGIEVFNHTCALQQESKSCAEDETFWNAVLATGRQCFGFFVPDHGINASDGDWQGRNILLVDAFTVEDCLRAYRKGRFYGALLGSGLAFTKIAAEPDRVTVETNGANRINFITETGVALEVEQPSAVFRVPQTADGQPGVAFVRVKAYDAQGETLFSQPMVYAPKPE
ncbi:MAG TPA: hypothetical protein PKY01_07875 [Candidatus Hydrogenedentes bacterium]|nr:hypothetical protein [Candidatus Hydrogenedentota bacterium]